MQKMPQKTNAVQDNYFHAKIIIFGGGIFERLMIDSIRSDKDIIINVCIIAGYFFDSNINIILCYPLVLTS